MKTFDTNAVIRLLVEDDEAQYRRAEAAWRASLAVGGVYLPKVVVVEAVWVLRRAYRFDRATVVKSIRRLLTVENVAVENRAEIERALTSFERGKADFSDYMILESAREADALPVFTFDERFSADEGVELMPA